MVLGGLGFFCFFLFVCLGFCLFGVVLFWVFFVCVFLFVFLFFFVFLQKCLPQFKMHIFLCHVEKAFYPVGITEGNPG